MNEQELYTKAINTYGVREQSAVATEECAELIQAINKHQRNGSTDTLSNLIEEIADVLIMIDQLKAMYNLSEEAINIKKNYKLCRLEQRLGKETEK